MKFRVWMALLLTGMLIMTSTACAGGSGIADKYECPVQGFPSFYLDLNKDGTFYLKKPSGEEITGKWKISGNEVQLESPMLTYADFPSRLKIAGNTLTVKRYEGPGGTMVFERR